MNINIQKFGGIVPRVAEHVLDKEQATIAHNVKLRNGALQPWREPCVFSQTGISGARSFHVHGCCTVAWKADVQSAEVSPDWARFFISGRHDYIEAVELSCECEPSYYRLGVPAPLDALNVTGTEACGRDTDARAYTYTYVNKWGEESAPAPVSDIIRVSDGSPVVLSGFTPPPAGYGVKTVNIYRLVSGTRDADGKIQKPMSDFLFVTSIKASKLSATYTYTDTMLMLGLGMPLETEDVMSPPADIENVVSIDDTVRLAGTHLNRIYMSEPYQLHNWPVKYELTLDSTIIHMGQISRKLFVTTDSHPYVIDVSNCDDTKCMPVAEGSAPLPDISCKYASSSIITPFGLVYSSPLGVVLVDDKARWHILTSKWFTKDDWADVAPHTARFGYYEGFLFIVTDAVSFVLNIDGEPYGDLKGSELSTISDSPLHMETSNTGKLLFLDRNGTVKIWDTGDTFRNFLWESKELSTGNNADLQYSWSPVSGKIRTEFTRFTLLCARGKVGLGQEWYSVFSRNVLSERPFRLPRSGRYLGWRVRLEGNREVEFLKLGTANTTLNRGA